MEDERKIKGTKGDKYTKEIITRILEEGCLDKYPSSKYKDGTPAHTLSVNYGLLTYDLTKGEFPITTLRPITTKNSIGEILWIYQDESNSLKLLREKYGIKWWDAWDIGNDSIGQVYGSTVHRHKLMSELLKGLVENPDSRRHFINLWQMSDFQEKHGLKPCAFGSLWNVRHADDGVDYLDMCLLQRSSDFISAGAINQLQYLELLYLVARHTGYTPGKFAWWFGNIQIYDRHIEIAKEMLKREPIDCHPYIWLNPEKKNFYDFTVDDIKVVGYSYKEVNAINPQFKDLEIAEEHVDTDGFDLEKFKEEQKVRENREDGGRQLTIQKK